MSYFYERINDTKKRKVKMVEGYLYKDVVLTQSSYEKIKSIFGNCNLKLDDFNKGLQAVICKKIFHYKFLWSCSNAKRVRCGKRETYKDIQFLLGEERGMVRRLYKYRPDLIEKGISICEGYVRSGFVNAYAPSMHRKNRTGNYDWNNIDILTVKEHEKESQRERESDKAKVLVTN